MKRCSQCEREYLDSYEECPFCSSSAPGVPPAKSPESLALESRQRLVRLVGWGSAFIILSALAVYLVTIMISGAESADSGLTDIERCFANQEQIEKAAAYRHARSGDAASEPGELLPVYLDRLPTCPSQGEYSIEWVVDAPKCSCTSHPWHGDAE